MAGYTHGVVIDTDAYAGNFERELCAYVTGQIGECEVGEEAAQLFLEDGCDPVPFENIIAQVPDDDHCCRPVALYPTPGRWNNGNGKHFDDSEHKEGEKQYPAYESVVICFDAKPSEDMVALIKERAQKFLTEERKWSRMHGLSDNRPKKILGFRSVEQETKELVEEL